MTVVDEKKLWTVSFTQYSMWKTCPQQYKLTYIDKLGSGDSNIFSVFGTSMHETIQTYLATMFEDTQTKADSMDLKSMLWDRMIENFKIVKERENREPCTKEEFREFYTDGLAILDWFGKRKNRIKFYQKRGWKLVGIELPLKLPVKNNVNFKAYLDIVLQDKETKKIKIIDIKTSTKGWNKFKKRDETVSNQIRLYKRFYAQQYGVDESQVDIEYHIVKRKLNEDIEYDRNHFSRFVPAHGTVSMNRAEKDFNLFLDSVFNEDGSFKSAEHFPKRPDKWQCKWCGAGPNGLKVCDPGIDVSS